MSSGDDGWRRYELRPNPEHNEPILPERLRLLSPGIMLAKNCTKPACSRASRAQARRTTVVARAAVDANRLLSAGAATVAALALLGGCEGTLSSWTLGPHVLLQHFAWQDASRHALQDQHSP